MKLKYIGTCDAVDVRDIGEFNWKQGEIREIADKYAIELLKQTENFEKVEEEQESKKRGDK